MTTTVVSRPASKSHKYGTAELVTRLIALGDGEALSLDLAPDCKWVNFHSAVYKKAKSEGFNLHYSLTNRTMTMWVSK